jgi:predicted enzyme related to lactoylglutathione lyase
MPTAPLIQKVDAVTIPVPDLDTGLRLYRDSLDHQLLWRSDEIGQAGLGLSGSDTEIVLTTRQGYEPNWLVSSADEAARAVQAAGGQVVTGPFDIPVGRVTVRHRRRRARDRGSRRTFSEGRSLGRRDSDVSGVHQAALRGRPS